MSSFRWAQEVARPDFDWQLLQSFRHVVESGSFRLAARYGNCALNTLRGRVANLEQITGCKLLERSQDGVVTTPDGDAVLVIAHAMSERLSEITTSLVEGRANATLKEVARRERRAR